ncbi:MAG: hypothetical protein U0R17_03555 [Acidimicrobiia bacterium]
MKRKHVIERRYTIVSLALLTGLFITVALPLQSAFAATQSITANGTWRSYTQKEINDLALYDHIGDPADLSSNPENATNSSPGWTPNGATNQRVGTSNEIAIVLDLPKVDLGCSSNVQISISGFADITNGSTSNNAQGFVINSSNEPLLGDHGFLEWNSTTDTPGHEILDDSITINPYAPAYGLKLILKVSVGIASDQVSWDVHNVIANYLYDDESGSCTPTTITSVPVDCNNDYLSTQATSPSDIAVNTFKTQFSPNANIEQGDIDKILSSQGHIFNPNLDVPTGSMSFVELDFTPQNALLSAGSVQLQVKFDVESLTPNPIYFYGIIYREDGSPAPWSHFQVYSDGAQKTLTTYLNSSELSNVRIYFLAILEDSGNQLSGKLSNAEVIVSQLHDVSVCGISALNSSSGSGSNSGSSSGNTNGVAANSLSSLPSTGKHSTMSFFDGILLVVTGFILLKFSKYKFNTAK